MLILGHTWKIQHHLCLKLGYKVRRKDLHQMSRTVAPSVCPNKKQGDRGNSVPLYGQLGDSPRYEGALKEDEEMCLRSLRECET